MKAFIYRFCRAILKWIARPTLTGADNIPDENAEVVYVLHHRAITDLAMLDIASVQAGLVTPFTSVQLEPDEAHAGFKERHRFFALYRSKGGRMTAPSNPERLLRLLESPAALRDRIVFVPVSVFWGRAMSGEGTLLKNITSEDWAVTGRIKRLLNLVINRRNIFVHTGRPIPASSVCDDDEATEILARRVSRLLRVRLRQQKQTALGPDFSHRRTLLHQVVTSTNVKRAISAEVANGVKPGKAERLARKYARTIASDMSHPTIRVLARLLRWFWNQIYNGIDVAGIESLEEVSASHTLVYVPSHRSHLDYLLLSYLLYFRGFMIPHIAAGDNLNLPLIGPILRRGGAFFMRRSFRDNPLYAAVFNEYLFEVYRHGHCVEFFPEGGRTRTGRLLPARMGLLKMTVDHQLRGLPKPLALVPVYFGYEKVVEGSSYLSELRGADKKSESVTDVFRNLKLIKQNFGSVQVNIGEAIKLDEWLAAEPASADNPDLERLGREVMIGINRQANLNPVNLVALVTLATPKIAIEEHRLLAQIGCYQKLLNKLHPDREVVTGLEPQEIVKHVEQLGLLTRDEEPFGAVLTHAPFSAVMMTWYRNNVVHTLALPSLIACLLVKRRRGVSAKQIQSMVALIYPYLANELSARPERHAVQPCLDAMSELGLLERSMAADEAHPQAPAKCLYSAPPPARPEHLQLTLLSNLVSQTLERMFIVIQQLTQGEMDRDTLRTRSQGVAQRISRLYGINAPEFSDHRLFDQFIDALLRHGMVQVAQDGHLTYDAAVERVLRAAEFVIDPQIRHGVLAAGSHT
ncbi:MAG: glycerol-3-phosphate 1-O-acyltransferase PlsB [bacterium]